MMPEKTVDLSILIVSYNTREMILDCLRSIFRETLEVSYEVIVVDNLSSDGSPEAISMEFPEVRLVVAESNLGFAAGNNFGARLARGRFLLLLNPDTRVVDRAIDRLLAFARNSPSAQIWGGRTFFEDGSINPSCLGEMTIWSVFCRTAGLTWLFPKSRWFNPEAVWLWDKLEQTREVDIVVGCFLLIDGDLWQALGGFDQRFYMYGEEADLCKRAKKMGAKPRICPSACIIHHGGGSEGSSEDKMIKVLKGKVTLAEVHWSPLWLPIFRLMLVLMTGLRASASKLIASPQRRGAGLDGKREIWSAVFRRRQEWLRGWKCVRSTIPYLSDGQRHESRSQT